MLCCMYGIWPGVARRWAHTGSEPLREVGRGAPVWPGALVGGLSRASTPVSSPAAAAERLGASSRVRWSHAADLRRGQAAALAHRLRLDQLRRGHEFGVADAHPPRPPGRPQRRSPGGRGSTKPSSLTAPRRTVTRAATQRGAGVGDQGAGDLARGEADRPGAQLDRGGESGCGQRQGSGGEQGGAQHADILPVRDSIEPSLRHPPFVTNQMWNIRSERQRLEANALCALRRLPTRARTAGS